MQKGLNFAAIALKINEYNKVKPKNKEGKFILFMCLVSSTILLVKRADETFSHPDPEQLNNIVKSAKSAEECRRRANILKVFIC